MRVCKINYLIDRLLHVIIFYAISYPCNMVGSNGFNLISGDFGQPYVLGRDGS